jgi:hypothetical protein|tara:strand:+ start:760 stop:867 length:108 start_codon:yes stop_codon:yes gene_type:complete
MDRIKTFEEIVDEWYDQAPIIDLDSNSFEVYEYDV